MFGDPLKLICAYNAMHIKVVVVRFEKTSEMDSGNFLFLKVLIISIKLPSMKILNVFEYTTRTRSTAHRLSRSCGATPEGI